MPPSKKLCLQKTCTCKGQHDDWQKIERGVLRKSQRASNGRSALKFDASGFHTRSQRPDQAHAIRRKSFSQNCLPMPASCRTSAAASGRGLHEWLCTRVRRCARPGALNAVLSGRQSRDPVHARAPIGRLSFRSCCRHLYRGIGACAAPSGALKLYYESRGKLARPWQTACHGHPSIFPERRISSLKVSLR
jgi:hypothetical protein